jgi:hypothetical protein
MSDTDFTPTRTVHRSAVQPPTNSDASTAQPRRSGRIRQQALRPVYFVPITPPRR